MRLRLLLLFFALPGIAAAEPSDGFSRRAEALAEVIRRKGGAELAELALTLETTSGRAALCEQLEAIEWDIDVQTRVEWFEKLMAGCFRATEEGLVSVDGFSEWLERRTEEFETGASETSRVVRGIAGSLEQDTQVARELTRVLERGYTGMIHAYLVEPRLRPHPVNRLRAGFFIEGDDGALVVPAALRERCRILLESYETFGLPPRVLPPFIGREWPLSARALASRIRIGDVLGERWRSFLDSPELLHLLSVLPESKPEGIRKILLDRTALGRLIVRERAGHWRLNPHLLYEAEQFMQEVAEFGRRDVELRGAIRGFGERIADDKQRRPFLSTGGNHVLCDLVNRTLVEEPEDALAAWMERYLERDGERIGIRDSVGDRADAGTSILIRAKEIARDLDAEGVRTSLDLDVLEFRDDRTHLLRSSIFYNPRTPMGGRLYSTEFPDHHTARLFGVFGWNAGVSKDREDFLARVRKRVPGLKALARTHDKLIFLVNTMPPWLSVHRGKGTFEGERRKNAEAHPPRDWEAWRTLIEETATLFSQVGGVERYYEFWNEPDLQYWQSGLDEFLRLYEVTVRAVKKADPEAKVGGAAVNQWDGRIKKAPDSDPLNLELIRYAGKRKLPLDFVSWHHFGRPVAAVREAKETYTRELKRAGFEKMPEFLVTEWSSPGRGTPYAPAFFADVMLALFEAGVDAQTAACLEEFHLRPDPKHFPPWGLLTQQGGRKSTWYVHRFFDQLSRGAEGVAVVRTKAGRTIIVARKPDRVFDILVWERGFPPRFAAAYECLKERGFGREQGRVYGTNARLEAAIRAANPADPMWQEAFDAARAVYFAHPVRARRLLLDLGPGGPLEVLASESATMGHSRPGVLVSGRTLTCPLEGYSVLRIVVRSPRQAAESIR